MKFTTTVDATQLKKGQLEFAGQPVKNNDIDAFALIPINGEPVKVSEGQWLVTYPDGTLEVHNTESIEASFVQTDPSETEVVITEQILEENPELRDNGIKIGDSTTFSGEVKKANKDKKDK